MSIPSTHFAVIVRPCTAKIVTYMAFTHWQNKLVLLGTSFFDVDYYSKAKLCVSIHVYLTSDQRIGKKEIWLVTEVEVN